MRKEELEDALKDIKNHNKRLAKALSKKNQLINKKDKVLKNMDIENLELRKALGFVDKRVMDIMYRTKEEWTEKIAKDAMNIIDIALKGNENDNRRIMDGIS
jgi:hypothetical protein